VCAVLDDLAIAPYVTIDELLGKRLGPGRPPRLSDAELVCLAVAQVLLGCHSERRWLRFVGRRLGHLFPYVPGQSGYNRRLRAAAPALRLAADHLRQLLETTLCTSAGKAALASNLPETMPRNATRITIRPRFDKGVDLD